MQMDSELDRIERVKKKKGFDIQTAKLPLLG